MIKLEALLKEIETLKESLSTTDESGKSSLCLEISKLYRNIQQYDNAIIYAELAKTHAQNDNDYYFGVWMISLLYKKMENIGKAIEGYNECIKHYTKLNRRLSLGLIVKNKSRLLNCPSLALQAIAILQGAEGAIEADIEDAYDSYIDVLLAVGDYKRALSIVENIKNPKLKAEVASRVQKHFI